MPRTRLMAQAEVVWLASADSGSGAVANSAPPTHGLSFSSNYPRELYSGSKYLFVSGVNGNYASSPDSVASSITGDIDIDACVALDDWTPASDMRLVSKLQAAGQRQYRLSVITTGRLRLDCSKDGTATLTVDSTVSPTVSDGGTLWVRVTRRSSDGRVQFFTSSDGSAWTQLGADVSVTSGALFDSTSILEIGSSFAGTDSVLRGKVFRARIYNGFRESAGTLVVDFNPALSVEPHSTITAATGEVWTINRSATGPRAALVDRALWIGGGTGFAETGDANSIDFAANESFTIAVVARRYGASALGVMASKAAGTASVGYSLYFAQTTGLTSFRLHDGSVAVEATAPAPTDGVVTFFAGVRDVTADTLTAYTGATAGTPVTDTTTATLANANTLRMGRFAGAGTNYGEQEIVAVALFRYALSANALAQLNREMQALVLGPRSGQRNRERRVWS